MGRGSFEIPVEKHKPRPFCYFFSNAISISFSVFVIVMILIVIGAVILHGPECVLEDPSGDTFSEVASVEVGGAGMNPL
jgi:hypothetical protein